MSTSLPSIRECEQQLATLAEAAAADADLAKAVQVGRALLHYVRNAGTPPVQEPTLKQQAGSLGPASRSRPMHLLRPAMPSDWYGARAERAAKAPAAAEPLHAATPAAAPAQPTRNAGLYRRVPLTASNAEMTGPEVLKHFRRDHAWLYRMKTERGFPDPVRQEGRMYLYQRAAVLEWEARNADARQPLRVNVAPDLPPQPEGTETIAQLCERVGRSAAWFKWICVNSPASEQPPEPVGKWGRHRVYERAALDAWLERRTRLMEQRGAALRKPLAP